MIDAHKYFGKPEYLDRINRTGWFLILSQLPPPQPGWAQQYNAHLQPAWARSFEPPAVCPLVTIRTINSLIDLYLYTGHERYMEPIPDAMEWMRKVRLPNGMWARFIELGTGKPLYYDRGRIRVTSVDQLSTERRTGYGYEQDLSQRLIEVSDRFSQVTQSGREAYLERQEQLATDSRQQRFAQLEPAVLEIISSQDDKGRWVTENDRFKRSAPGRRWEGEYRVEGRISSSTFCRNISLLCEYLELLQALQ
jgi:hypothetical protein